MKTIITIEHISKMDLSNILEKVSYDVSRGYIKSSGVFSAYAPAAVAPDPGCISTKRLYMEEDLDIPLSTYEFYTE